MSSRPAAPSWRPRGGPFAYRGPPARAGHRPERRAKSIPRRPW